MITQQLQVGDFAKAIGVTRQVVNKWIRLGRLPGVTTQRNGHHRIPAHFVDEVKRGELPLKPRRGRAPNVIPMREAA